MGSGADDTLTSSLCLLPITYPAAAAAVLEQHNALKAPWWKASCGSVKIVELMITHPGVG